MAHYSIYSSPPHLALNQIPGTSSPLHSTLASSTPFLYTEFCTLPTYASGREPKDVADITVIESSDASLSLSNFTVTGITSPIVSITASPMKDSLPNLVSVLPSSQAYAVALANTVRTVWGINTKVAVLSDSSSATPASISSSFTVEYGSGNIKAIASVSKADVTEAGASVVILILDPGSLEDACADLSLSRPSHAWIALALQGTIPSDTSCEGLVVVTTMISHADAVQRAAKGIVAALQDVIVDKKQAVTSANMYAALSSSFSAHITNHVNIDNQGAAVTVSTVTDPSSIIFSPAIVWPSGR